MRLAAGQSVVSAKVDQISTRNQVEGGQEQDGAGQSRCVAIQANVLEQADKVLTMG